MKSRHVPFVKLRVERIVKTLIFAWISTEKVIPFFMLSMALCMVLMSAPIYAEPPKKESKPSASEKNASRPASDSGLKSAKWDNTGVAATGCFWICKSAAGCKVAANLSKYPNLPVYGFSGSGKGDIYSENSKVVAAPPGSLIKANGWHRQCDETAPPGKTYADISFAYLSAVFVNSGNNQPKAAAPEQPQKKVDWVGNVPNFIAGYLRALYGENGLDAIERGMADLGFVDLDEKPSSSDMNAEEVIVAWKSGKYCGSGGCSTHVLKQATAAKFVIVADAPGFGKEQFLLGNKYTKGMMDILIAQKAFVWNGKRYVMEK